MLKDEIEKVLEEFHDFILEIKDAPAIEYNDAVNKQISQALTRILALVEKDRKERKNEKTLRKL